MMLIGGIDFVGEAAYFAGHPEAAQDVETLGLPAFASDAVVGIFAGIVAVFVLTRRAYRPDLGDSAFSDRNLRWLLGLPRGWNESTRQRAESGDRSWWTGERRKDH